MSTKNRIPKYNTGFQPRDKTETQTTNILQLGLKGFKNYLKNLFKGFI